MEATMDTVEEAIGNQFRAFHKRLELRDVTLEKLDSRIGSFEEHLAREFAYQDEVYDQKFAKFEELLQSFTNQAGPDNTRAFRRSSSTSPSRSTRRTQGVTSLATIDFPRFNGDKLKEWLFQVEQFFEIEHTPEDVKVNLASRHMEDVAANWHQSLENSEYGYLVLKDWQTYRDVLVEKLEDLWEDPVSEQKNLRKTNEQCDVIDEMIQSVQSWRAEMKAMFTSWREEDLIEKRTRKEELSPIEKYFASKQSFMAQDSLTLLHATGPNTSLGDKPYAEIVEPEVNDPARASDPLDLMAVVLEGSSDMSPPYMVLDDDLSLDSSTEVLQHHITTDSTLNLGSDELTKEPIMLAKYFLATNSMMEENSMVFQVSISKLEPCLEVHTVSVGVGGVRQVELELDDSFAHSFESFKVSFAEDWPAFFLESTDVMVKHKPLEVSKSWMFKYKYKAAEKQYPDIQSFYSADLYDVVLASHQEKVTRETRSNRMAVNWPQRRLITTLFLCLKPKVLVVQEKTRRFQAHDIWRFSTVVVHEGEYIFLHEGEYIPDGSVREVKEETGVDTDFVQVLAFSQTHKAFLGKSDLFVWMVQPLSLELKAHESGIKTALVHFALDNIGFSNWNEITVIDHSSVSTSDLTTQFLELLPHYGTVLKLNFLQPKEFQRLFPLEPIDSMLVVFLSRCEVTSFPLGCAATDRFFTALPTPSAQHHVVLQVIQVWDPGGADVNLLDINEASLTLSF